MRFTEISAADFGWAYVKIVKHRIAALIHARTTGVRHVMIDSDFGKTGLAARFLGMTLSVLEEGVGTYRVDLLPKSTVEKCYQFLGCFGGAFGTSVVTKEIFVTNKALYFGTVVAKYGPKTLVRAIPNPVDVLVNSLSEYEKLFESDVGPRVNAKNCLVILSGWDLPNPNQLSSQGAECDVFLKPHPHVPEQDLQRVRPYLGNTRLLGKTVPVELTILRLSQLYDNVLVAHSGSSAEFYLASANAHLGNLRFVPLSDLSTSKLSFLKQP